VPEREKAFWTTQEVADYLELPLTTVKYCTYHGMAPRSYKIGRRRMFRPADVRKWVERKAEEPRTA
jgi:excisionase family DNA binding protein